MTLMPPDYYTLPIEPKTPDTDKKDLNSSVAPHDRNQVPEHINNIVNGNRRKQPVSRLENLRKASTLPRGFGAGSGSECLTGLDSTLSDIGRGPGGSDDGEVMGLCGDLLRHWSEESAVAETNGEAGDPLRRSDPSLSCMTSTLDRRLRLRAGRPRSLDLSSASIDSKVSAATTASSGSEEGSVQAAYSRQRTFREDLTNDTIPESEQSRKNSAQESPPEMLGSIMNLEESPLHADNEELTCTATKVLSTGPVSCNIMADELVKPLTKEIFTEESAQENTVVDASSGTSSQASRLSHSDLCSSSKTSDVSKRKSHCRSSSDVTRKSLSSSASNISSLYYDGDTENFMDTLKSTASSRKGGDESINTESANRDDNPTNMNVIVSRQTSVKNRNSATLSRSPTTKNAVMKPSNSATEQEQPRTVLVLTGGQGYKCIRDDAPSSGPPHNNTDAHLLVWEMKL